MTCLVCRERPARIGAVGGGETEGGVMTEQRMESSEPDGGVVMVAFVVAIIVAFVVGAFVGAIGTLAVTR
jgi:hypothetical protein